MFFFFIWVLAAHASIVKESFKMWVFAGKMTKVTRTVRKSDYTPALAFPKHMASILDEKCTEKEKYREEQIGECPLSISRHNLSL